MTLNEAKMTIYANVVYACEKAEFSPMTIKMVKDACDTVIELAEQADTPQTEDEYFLELMDAVKRGEMSDASANQAYYEYINKQAEESDTPQTDSGKPIECDGCGEHICIGCEHQAKKEAWRKAQTDCGWK